MKNKLLFLIAFFAISQVYSQPINVSTDAYTVPQLVENILFGSQSTTGTGIISNITWSTGTNFGSTNGIGHFTNTNTNLPINAGIILTTGSATATVGPNNNYQSYGSWSGDTQLFNYINGLGIDPVLNSFNDATLIEFDFIPLINNMSFDFIFASEEYGTYQCTYSDAFAFFVNDVTLGTPVENIALVPNTNTPISVVTIRNQLYNPGCSSQNEQYFDNYYLLPEGINPNTAPINFNGQTTVMSASKNVTPNHTYHIKLVVADRNDHVLDSGVFISAGSFYLGQELRGMYGSGYESYKDFTILNGGALCNGETRRINLGVMPITGATYEWYKDNVLILDANSYFYDVTEPGLYAVKMKFANNGEVSDSFVVESYTAMNVGEPTDLTSQTLLFDLTENVTTILNGQDPNDYEIGFYTTLMDAQNQANQISNTNNYSGFDGEQIFVSIQDFNTGCTTTKSFFLSQLLSNDSFNSFDILIQPNPVKDVLHLSADENIKEVKIINLLGQELYSKSFDEQEVQIDLLHFSNGTYIVKVNTNDGFKTVKVVKN